MKATQSFILANLTWNSRRWEGPSPDRSGFKWVARDPKKHVAAESWNFKPGSGYWQRGFFENLGRDVRAFDDGGIVFFLSRNISEGRQFIVGFFAGARVFQPKWKHGRGYSIQAPRRYCLRLPDYLPVDKKLHIPPGKTFGRYFLYITRREAHNILADMLRLAQRFGPEDLMIAQKLTSVAQAYFPGIRPSHGGVTAPVQAGGDTLRQYIAREYDAQAHRELIHLVKDNAKLRRSFLSHERVKAAMASYFSAKGYEVRRNSHLDLLVTKSRQSVIVEVKSCREDNIETQIRLGVAQLWYYSYLCRPRYASARRCLALEVEPPARLLPYILEHCGFDLAYLSGGRVQYINGKPR